MAIETFFGYRNLIESRAREIRGRIAGHADKFIR